MPTLKQQFQFCRRDNNNNSNNNNNKWATKLYLWE